jgi:hypothetical protein
MSTLISGLGVKFGRTDGGVRVANGGKLTVVGVVAGTLTVESGGYGHIIGMVGGLVIEPGVGPNSAERAWVTSPTKAGT